MKEDFLHYIWKNALFRSPLFSTKSGKRVEVIDVGEYNRDAGPDFFNARIRIDGILWSGNVEIHLRSSDWYRHRHHKDPAYNNVILSVVERDDIGITNSRQEIIPCIELDFANYLYLEYLYISNALKRPSCHRLLETLEDSLFYIHTGPLVIERLQRKTDDIMQILKLSGNDWGETLYRLLCRYWSGHVNKEPFYALATYLPFRTLLRYRGNLAQLEALLFGVSGLLAASGNDSYTDRLKTEYAYLKRKHQLSDMSPEQWKFMRIRPDAFPTVRIALLAALIDRAGNFISRLPDIDSIRELKKLFDTTASLYWNTHYSFNKLSPEREKRIGETMKRHLVINVIVPFWFVYGKEHGKEEWQQKALKWLEEEEPESNFIINIWKEYGFSFDSALQTQAVIQLYREYCEKKRCLHCRIGREALAARLCGC